MHYVKGSADIALSVFGGLCTEMTPSDLPEGASPLNYDVDYLVGSVKTRDGIQSVYSLGAITNSYLPLGIPTPDLSGFSFRSAIALTNWNASSFEFIPGHASAIYFTIRMPSSLASPSTGRINLDIFCADISAHTVLFQTSDGNVTGAGTFNVSLASAPQQTYTTLGTAYQRQTLSFAVQSGFASGDTLVCKIATSTLGTAPTSNMIVYPYFSVDLNTT
jgi:hypothetical protein